MAARALPARIPLRHRRRTIVLVLIVLGALLIALAHGSTFSVRDAQVTDQHQVSTTEPIVVDSRARPVYVLTGDSVAHPQCTRLDGCFDTWIPVKMASASSRPTLGQGVVGPATLWHRDGLFQVVLGGHPVYTYVGDLHRDTGARHSATGEGVRSFGGTWHVLTGSSG